MTSRRSLFSRRKNKAGFTIVELLIVIVVIAILATITIVAYNGIQNRAKASAAQSAAAQANKKILTYAVQNSDQYPASLTAAGIVDGNTAFQYSVNNAVSPRTYGLTATNGTFSYFVSNATAQPTAGGYKGHGQGGVAPITNLAINPAATSYGSTPGGWWNDRYGASGTYSLVTGAGDGIAGLTTYARLTFNNSSTTRGGRGFHHSSNTDIASHNTATLLPVSPSATYTISAWFRQKNFGSPVPYSMHTRSVDAAGTSISGSAGTDTILNDGVWTKVSTTYTTTSNAAFLAITSRFSGALNGPVAGGDTLDGTGLMISQGSTSYTYADGNSPNWIWNGSANQSTSTGPAQ